MFQSQFGYGGEELWNSVYPGTPNSQHLVPGTPNSHLGSGTPNSHLGSVTPTSHHAPPTCTTPQTHHTLTNVVTNNNAYFPQFRFFFSSLSLDFVSLHQFRFCFLLSVLFSLLSSNTFFFTSYTFSFISFLFILPYTFSFISYYPSI